MELHNEQKKGLFEFIEKEKQRDSSKTVEILINEYEADNEKIENLAEIYKELADHYPKERKELLEKSASNNRFIVRNTDIFFNNIRNEDENDNYKCTIFPPKEGKTLNFPCGSLSYLGARTSRGKTTAMISIVIDALHQHKTVAIITNEESPDEIQLRLVTALMFTTKRFKIPSYMDDPRETMREIIKEILQKGNTLFSNQEPNKDNIREYLTFYCRKALLELQEYYKNSKLTIFNGLDAPKFNDMLDFVGMLEPKTVVILDYIQHSRTPAGYETSTRQMQIQEASHLLTDEMKKRGLICIAGAQFKRDGAYKLIDDATEDTIQDGLFRESGDIEQDGHINIGIGALIKKGATPIRYYSIFKNRSKGTDYRYFLIDTEGIGFSFIQVQFKENGITPQEYESPKSESKIVKSKPRKLAGTLETH